MAHLPLVDLGPVRRGGPDRDGVVTTVDEACRGVGAFLVVGHEIDPALTEATFSAARRFFALPAAAKHDVALERHPSLHRGYVGTPGGRSGAGVERNEALDLGIDHPAHDPAVLAGTPMHGPNPWPDLDGFAEVVGAYQRTAITVAGEILEAMARALDLAPDHFARRMRRTVSRIRLLRYPADPSPGPASWGRAPHVDPDLLAVTARTGDGLEVRDRAGVWRDVDPPPGALVVTVGELLARWTNDRWVAPSHRVAVPRHEDRYAMSLLVDPDYHAVIECLPTCVDADRPARYGPVRAGEHLWARIQGARARVADVRRASG